jgi:hypothetical protein
MLVGKINLISCKLKVKTTDRLTKKLKKFQKSVTGRRYAQRSVSTATYLEPI